jgi:hypothetical protein
MEEILQSQDEFTNIEQTSNSDRPETRQRFLTKIIQMSNIFTFTKKYSSSILLLYKKFIPLYTTTLTDCFDIEIKPFFKFMKDLSTTYSNYSNEIQKINNDLPPPSTSEVSQPSSCLYNILTKSQTYLSDSLLQMSHLIKTNSQNKHIYSKLESFSSKLTSRKNTLTKLLEKIEYKIHKLSSFYDKEYSQIVTSFKVNYNNSDIIETYRTFPDFILMYMKLLSLINKLYAKLAIFLNETNLIFEEMITSYCEFYALLREYVSIYITHMKYIINNDVMKQYGNIDEFYMMCSNDKIQEKFSIAKILGSHDKILLDTFNKILMQLQECLVQDDNNGVNKEIIENDKNFEIGNYPSLTTFVKFLISTIPRQCEIEYSNLVKHKFEVRLTGGLFKVSKPVTLLLTYQEHLIVIIHNDITIGEDDSNDNDNMKFNTYIVMDTKFINLKPLKGKKYLIQLNHKYKDKDKEKDNKSKDSSNKQKEKRFDFNIFKGKVSYTLECLSQDKVNKIISIFPSAKDNYN